MQLGQRLATDSLTKLTVWPLVALITLLTFLISRGFMNEKELLDLVSDARVATLATIRADGRVDLVPITFAYDESLIVTAIDHKRKSTIELKRLDNIRQFPEVTLLVDHYDDQDWERLWWVRIRGRARVYESGAEYEAALGLLQARYPQYLEKRPLGAAIVIERTEITGWSSKK